ncbi:VOC family protein [Paraburkholderia sediminicola]|nr:VOC family protein [Paraburkholderia sediminicola]
MTVSTLDFNFKGLDHIALTIGDMKKSIDFYHGVLGLPILHTLRYENAEGALVGQHFFLGVGAPDNPDAHIALFWWKDGYQTLSKEELTTGKKPANKFARPIGGMLHLNLRADADKMEAYANKLGSMGVPFRHVTRYAAGESEIQATGMVNVGMRGITSRDSYHLPGEGWLMNSIYVHDPDGIEIEFNAWASAWRDWPANEIPASNDDLVVLNNQSE